MEAPATTVLARLERQMNLCQDLNTWTVLPLYLNAMCFPWSLSNKRSSSIFFFQAEQRIGYGLSSDLTLVKVRSCSPCMHLISTPLDETIAKAKWKFPKPIITNVDSVIHYIKSEKSKAITKLDWMLGLNRANQDIWLPCGWESRSSVRFNNIVLDKDKKLGA